MNQKQHAARERAVLTLAKRFGGDTLCEVDASIIVDAILEAATPGLSEHAEAVQGLATSHEPDPRD